MIYVFVFIFGAIIGSFLNVVILRYNTGESIIRSNSRCLNCGKQLFWYELIPILSFLIQKGHCRKCHSKISWQYPIVETITGIVFVLIFWKVWNLGIATAFGGVPPQGGRIWNLFGIWDLGFGNLLSLLLATGYWLLIASLLIVISVYDIRHQIIPNKFVYTLIILSLVSIFLDFGHWDLFRNWDLEIRNSALLSRILSGIGFFVFFALLWLVSRGHWMGLGDAKIALASGWLLGPIGGLIAFFMSFWLGAIFSVFLLIFAPKKFKLESRIPFGPFLALGTLIAFLFGNNILQIYLNIAGLVGRI